MQMETTTWSISWTSIPRADSCPIRQSWTFKFQRKLLQVQLLEMYLVYLQVQGMSGDANSLTNVKIFHRLSFSVVGGHIISSSKATSRWGGTLCLVPLHLFYWFT
jgi:hypothetical protein